MRRTLGNGWRLGFTTGLGIATGDGVYASIAALGLSSVSRFMLAYDRPLHFLAGLILLYLGLKTFVARPPRTELSSTSTSTASNYLSALILTLTNPPTIVSFAASFAVLAPATGLAAGATAQTVAGVFLGSTAWWLLISTTVTIGRHTLGRRAMRWIDGITGILLSAFGVAEIRRTL